jgi:hypothetical protein
VLVARRTRLKNRLSSTLAKYGLAVAASDPFGAGARTRWAEPLPQLPPQTQFVTEQLLRPLDFLQQQID